MEQENVLPKESLLINRAFDCNIDRFISCLFDQDYQVLVIKGDVGMDQVMEAWETIYEEYLTLSGSGRTGEEIELLARINSLHIRMETIKVLLQLQRDSVFEFSLPFLPGFPALRKYGHRLNWNKTKPDILGFIAQLESIENREKRTGVEFDASVAQLKQFYEKKASAAEADKKQDRTSFLRLMTQMQKQGYVIDRERTSIEEYAIMQKDFADEIERIKQKKREGK